MPWSRIKGLFRRKKRLYQVQSYDSLGNLQASDYFAPFQAELQQTRHEPSEQGESSPIRTPNREPRNRYTNPEHNNGWEPWPLHLELYDQDQFDQATSRSCVVCLEDHTYDSFPNHLISDSCAHIPSICTECLRTYLRTEVNDKAWSGAGIKCPEPECEGILDYVDVQEHADRETFTRFAHFLDDQLLVAMETFFRCPARGCGSGQEHVSGQSQPIVTCVKCNERFCFRHKVPWAEHETMSCAEFDAFLADPAFFRSQFQLANEAAEREHALEKKRRRQQEEYDRAFAQTLLEDEQREEAIRQGELERRRRENEEREERAAEARRRKQEQQEKERRARETRRRQEEESANLSTIRRTTKRCPSCQWPIEKNEGCDHMTCIKCRHEFCFICTAPYSGSGGIVNIGNKAHKRSCKYYA